MKFVLANNESTSGQLADPFDLSLQHSSVGKLKNVQTVRVRGANHGPQFRQHTIDEHGLGFTNAACFRRRCVFEKLFESFSKPTGRFVSGVQLSKSCTLIFHLNLSNGAAQSSCSLVAVKRHAVIGFEPAAHSRWLKAIVSQILIFPSPIGIVLNLPQQVCQPWRSRAGYLHGFTALARSKASGQCIADVAIKVDILQQWLLRRASWAAEDPRSLNAYDKDAFEL